MIMKSLPGIFPGRISFGKNYLKLPIRKWLSRMSEHGILMFLGSMADQLETLNDMNVKRISFDANINDTKAVNTNFEYWLLTFGLLAACCVFFVELICDCLKR